jgi:ribonuclease HII
VNRTALPLEGRGAASSNLNDAALLFYMPPRRTLWQMSATKVIGAKVISEQEIERLDEDALSPSARKMRMLKKLHCGLRYEKEARAAGAVMVAGVDEVGRGALFGPVVAAAVILPPECRIRGLRDSKQLEREDRERLAKIVEARALCFAIEEVDAETIDRVNIYQASKLAMLGAIARLMPAADHLLIDAMRLDLPCAQTCIIYGDSLSISIAAASVIAKVYRDRRMCEYHEQWPQYGLHSHKGYSTPEHKRALAEHGPTPLHRFSFRPVAQRSLPWDYPTAMDIFVEGEQLGPTPDVRDSAPGR